MKRHLCCIAVILDLFRLNILFSVSDSLVIYRYCSYCEKVENIFNMKKLLFLLPLVICACGSNSKTDLNGRWIEILPDDAGYFQGMELKSCGVAESIGMSTLIFDSWKVEGDRLFLKGESIGNGQTLQFTDTLDIISLKNDTLVLKRGEQKLFYVRQDCDSVAVTDKKAECCGQTKFIAPVKGHIYKLKGTVCIGHEVRSFCPEGSSEDYWIVDRTGRLYDIYDKATGGVKNGKPLTMTLTLEYDGKWDDGFAADYPGVYIVKEINGCCGQCEEDGQLIGGSDAAMGYSYSKMLDRKIRVFEEGVRLTAYDEQENNLAGYLVFNEDSSNVELFLPEIAGTVILDRRSRPDGKYVWNVEDDDTFMVENKDGMWIISRRGKKLYRS